MPYYLAIGVSYEKFMDSCPTELEPFLKAYKMQRNKEDVLQWQLGQYMAAAVSCIFPKGKYPKKPMFQIDEEKKEFTEKDIQMAILTEQRYMAAAINKGLPETIIL